MRTHTRTIFHLYGLACKRATARRYWESGGKNVLWIAVGEGLTEMVLNQRIALVTGGGSGIGEAIAKRFAREGAMVIVADIVLDRAARVASEIEADRGRATAVDFDVADPDAVQSTITNLTHSVGVIDILVNNAGLSLGDDILTIEAEVWDRNLAVVLRGPYLCSRAVLPTMIEQHCGVIINISSVNGMTGLGEEAYSAAKSGLLNLTQNMAIRYGQFGVRCNAISPGTVRTPIWSERVAKTADVFDQLRVWYPLQRVGEADDIANAAMFLASDEASFITGINLPVDGGLTAGSYGMSRSLQGTV